ncbi:MAG: hypothetical protein U9N07_07315 [Euryarchaeota archaeon]|nr:hypothetical protein [Euryarchaeota archaeon]
MDNKKYYAARKGILKPEPADFQLLKNVFLRIYREFEHDHYFEEAAGYDYVSISIPRTRGRWGCGDSDIKESVYLELGMDIWPIEENIEWYDEPTLFTVIEFLYDNVSEKFGGLLVGFHYDQGKGREKYRARINEILKYYDPEYELSSDGEILEIAPTGLEPIFEEIVQTDDPENIDMRIQSAISKYMKYGATISDKKDAVRALADVLEFLKKSGIRLQKKDESDLFKIINNFDIRHHNKSQQGEYDKEIWYDWMFYTFLSSINVLLKLKGGENGN